MINQQLVDFIKSQLTKGVDKETITKELLGGGWTQVDIDEGFKEINISVVNTAINPSVSNNVNNSNSTPTTNHIGKKTILIIVALFILASGASGYYFRNDIPVIKNLIKSNNILESEITDKDDTKSEIQQEETKNITNEPELNQNLTNNIDDEKGAISNTKINPVTENKTPSKSSEKQPLVCGQSSDKRTQLDCILMKVKESGDIKICNLLDKLNYEDNNEKQLYKDACYSYSVIATKNISTCDMILNIEIKDACYNQIAILTQDIKTCGIIKDTRMQEECYQKTIYTNKDIKSCELLNRLDLKDKCYSDTAINIKNFEICNLISNLFDKFTCLSLVDISKVNNSLCSSLSNEYFANQSERGFCYSSVAHYKKDPNICKNITNDDEYNGCLYDFIRYESLYDIKICSMFRSDDNNDIKNSCIRDIAANTKDKLLCETQIFNDEYDQIEIKAIIDGCKDRIK